MFFCSPLCLFALLYIDSGIVRCYKVCIINSSRRADAKYVCPGTGEAAGRYPPDRMNAGMSAC